MNSIAISGRTQAKLVRRTPQSWEKKSSTPALSPPRLSSQSRVEVERNIRNSTYINAKRGLPILPPKSIAIIGRSQTKLILRTPQSLEEKNSITFLSTPRNVQQPVITKVTNSTSRAHINALVARDSIRQYHKVRFLRRYDPKNVIHFNGRRRDLRNMLRSKRGRWIRISWRGTGRGRGGGKRGMIMRRGWRRRWRRRKRRGRRRGFARRKGDIKLQGVQGSTLNAKRYVPSSNISAKPEPPLTNMRKRVLRPTPIVQHDVMPKYITTQDHNDTSVRKNYTAETVKRSHIEHYVGRNDLHHFKDITFSKRAMLQGRKRRRRWRRRRIGARRRLRWRRTRRKRRRSRGKMRRRGIPRTAINGRRGLHVSSKSTVDIPRRVKMNAFPKTPLARRRKITTTFSSPSQFKRDPPTSTAETVNVNVKRDAIPHDVETSDATGNTGNNDLEKPSKMRTDISGKATNTSLGNVERRRMIPLGRNMTFFSSLVNRDMIGSIPGGPSNHLVSDRDFLPILGRNIRHTANGEYLYQPLTYMGPLSDNTDLMEVHAHAHEHARIKKHIDNSMNSGAARNVTKRSRLHDEGMGEVLRSLENRVHVLGHISNSMATVARKSILETPKFVIRGRHVNAYNPGFLPGRKQNRIVQKSLIPPKISPRKPPYINRHISNLPANLYTRQNKELVHPIMKSLRSNIAYPRTKTSTLSYSQIHAKPRYPEPIIRRAHGEVPKRLSREQEMWSRLVSRYRSDVNDRRKSTVTRSNVIPPSSYSHNIKKMLSNVPNQNIYAMMQGSKGLGSIDMERRSLQEPRSGDPNQSTRFDNHMNRSQNISKKDMTANRATKRSFVPHPPVAVKLKMNLNRERPNERREMEIFRHIIGEGKLAGDRSIAFLRKSTNRSLKDKEAVNGANMISKKEDVAAKVNVSNISRTKIFDGKGLMRRNLQVKLASGDVIPESVTQSREFVPNVVRENVAVIRSRIPLKHGIAFAEDTARKPHLLMTKTIQSSSKASIATAGMETRQPSPSPKSNIGGQHVMLHTPTSGRQMNNLQSFVHKTEQNTRQMVVSMVRPNTAGMNKPANMRGEIIRQQWRKQGVPQNMAGVFARHNNPNVPKPKLNVPRSQIFNIAKLAIRSPRLMSAIEKAASQMKSGQSREMLNFTRSNLAGSVGGETMAAAFPRVNAPQNNKRANIEKPVPSTDPSSFDPDKIGKTVSLAMNQLKRDKMWGQVYVSVPPSGKIRVVIEETKRKE